MADCGCEYPDTRPARCRCSPRWDEQCDYCDWLDDHDCEGENEDAEES